MARFSFRRSAAPAAPATLGDAAAPAPAAPAAPRRGSPAAGPAAKPAAKPSKGPVAPWMAVLAGADPASLAPAAQEAPSAIVMASRLSDVTPLRLLELIGAVADVEHTNRDLAFARLQVGGDLFRMAVALVGSPQLLPPDAMAAAAWRLVGLCVTCGLVADAAPYAALVGTGLSEEVVDRAVKWRPPTGAALALMQQLISAQPLSDARARAQQQVALQATKLRPAAAPAGTSPTGS